jgi:hypothetical protein
MKILIALITAAACAVLTACGLDVVSSAATGAAIKKQEIEQGKKTMEQAQQKIDQAMQLQQQQQQQRTESSQEK